MMNPFDMIRRFLLRRKIERDILREIGTLKENSRSWGICGKCGGKDIKRTHCADWGHWHLECAACGNCWMLMVNDTEAKAWDVAYKLLVGTTPPQAPGCDRCGKPWPPGTIHKCEIDGNEALKYLDVHGNEKRVPVWGIDSTNVMNEGDLS